MLLGGWHSEPANAWIERTDHKNRYGYIYELNYPHKRRHLTADNITANTTTNITTNTTTSDATRTPVVILPTTPPPSLIFTFLPLKTRPLTKILFKVMYLTTYQNAGKFAVQICGQPPIVVDTLDSEFQTHRFSLPTMHTQLTDYKQCLLQTKEKQNVQIMFEKINDFTNSNTTTNNINMQEVRGNQKVKIISISACFVW